jgi:hypothetical protein
MQLKEKARGRGLFLWVGRPFQDLEHQFRSRSFLASDL